MKTLKRFDLPNRSYFITCVTSERRKILIDDIDLFWQCWKTPSPTAWVILPDHFHFLLNNDKRGISNIMHDFKITYSRRYRDKYKPGRVWQNRFWDHIIRDENDMHRYIDYIHYNPVKHGLVNNPFNYAHSSLSEYAKTRSYTPDWGVKDAENPDGEFGE